MVCRKRQTGSEFNIANADTERAFIRRAGRSMKSWEKQGIQTEVFVTNASIVCIIILNATMKPSN